MPDGLKEAAGWMMVGVRVDWRKEPARATLAAQKKADRLDATD